MTSQSAFTDNTFAGKILAGKREMSQQELLERVAKAANGFIAMGVGQNDAVAMLLRNDFSFFEATMAANLIGAYAVPVNWHFVSEEIEYILRDCEAKVLVAHADLLANVKESIPDATTIFVVPTPEEIQIDYRLGPEQCALKEGQISWTNWIDQQQQRPVEMPTSPSSMIYTSGTTGNPKGVRRDQPTPESAAVLARVITTIFGLGEKGDFRTAITGPMYHAAPNAYGLFAVRNGGFCILQPRFDPEQLLQMIEDYKLTHLHMVPTMFVRLLQLPEAIRNRYDLSSLKFVAHAAAPCPPDIKRQMIEWWGPVINEYYGGTETGGVVFHTSEEALRKPGTVGKPIEGGMVKIFDDDGKSLGPNEIGEVYLKIKGYADFTYNKLDEKRQEVEREGLISIGDVGYVDEDGYLFLCDRKKDMVISGGANIYPAEIEAVLIQMPGVKDCAVFGIPDQEFGEALCTYIQLLDNTEIGAKEVVEYLSNRMAKYKVPKVIEIVQDLPREDSGKIFKRKLKAPYWEGLNRNI